VGEAVRGWAVEVDRATEGLSVIRHKAVAYKAIAENPDFYGREWHGRMPIPLWLVPDRVRAAAILDVWATVWPGGRWLLMTEASLPRLVAVEYRAGETRQVTLLDGWAPGGGSVRTGQRQT
jgi:hypothetical protein